MFKNSRELPERLLADCHYEDGEVFIDGSDCEVELIRGERAGNGVLTLQIGALCISFNDIGLLLEKITPESNIAPASFSVIG